MTDRDGRVLPVTRALSIAIIPFLVVAFVVLFAYPDDTRRLFAWPISPRMTPDGAGLGVPGRRPTSSSGRLGPTSGIG